MLCPHCASDLDNVVKLHHKLIVGLRTRKSPQVQPSEDFLELVGEQSDAIARLAAALKA